MKIRRKSFNLIWVVLLSISVGLFAAFVYLRIYSNVDIFNKTISVIATQSRIFSLCELSRAGEVEFSSKQLSVTLCKAKYLARTEGVYGCMHPYKNDARNSQETFVLYCLTEIATHPKSIEECNQIPVDNIKYNWCFFNLAERKKDASICKNIPSEWLGSLNYEKILCIDNVAKGNKNIEACNNHESTFYIEDCQKNVKELVK